MLELASDTARIRGLYKLLHLDFPVRILEIVGKGNTSVLFGDQAIGDTMVISANLNSLGYRDVDYNEIEFHSTGYILDASNHLDEYDLIILHDTLCCLQQSLASPSMRSTTLELFTALNRLLKPSGTIAGCFSNRFSTRRLSPDGIRYTSAVSYTHLTLPTSDLV